MDDYKNHRRHHQQQEKESEKMERYSRDLDLLHGFSASGVSVTDDNVNKVSITQNQYLQRFHEKLQHEEEEEEDEGVELNLGLSLGGRFGVDKNAKKKKLLRSSSVVGTTPLFREDEAVAFPALMRTSSLPTETKEEWRRRKEMQTLRRMEARRRRSEKQRVSREVAVAGAGVEETEMSLIKFGSSPVTLLPPGWGVGVPMKQVVLGDVLGKEKGKGFQGLFGHPSSQGSVDSHGGSSSLGSEMDSETFPGASSCGGEAKSPASIQSTQERRGQDPVGSGGKTNEKLAGTSKAEVVNPSNKPHPSKTIMGGQIGTNSMEDMPCVFTKGDGPNGRRIEGILYKYGKGEEVRIMCVCHGNFLSPAEFVKHAGGRDVANPLKHIVVNPSAAPF